MHYTLPFISNISLFLDSPSLGSLSLSLSLALMASLLASHQPPEGSYRILFNPGLEAEPAWIKPEVFQVENLLNFSYDDDDKIKLITGFTAINYNYKPENPNIIKDAEKRSEQKYKGQSDEVLEEDTECYQFALTKESEWQDYFLQEGTCLNYSSLKLPEERRRGGYSPNSVLLGHSQCQVEQYTTTTTKEEEEEGKKCFRPCFHSARKIIAGSKARSKRARPSSSGARAWSYLTPILHHHNTFIPSLSAILTEFESQSSCTAMEVDKEDDENEGDEDEHYAHDFLPPTKRAKKKAKKVIRFSNEVGQHQVSLTNNSTSTTTTTTTTITTTNTTTRRCSHCLTQKTPQWRAGPEGPKTLCNACGVRYKSGRLLPEYRPAGSPTFVSWVHSNSHRKILEMRKLRQEEDTDPLGTPSPLTHQHQQQGGGSNALVVISDSIGVTTDST